LLGGNGEEVTPVPIPNTEVKLFSADGSEGLSLARVGRCQAKTKSSKTAAFFVYNHIFVKEAAQLPLAAFIH
jgi:hypothetical protein